MLFRLLMLISLIGYTTGPDLREDTREPGGKGFGTVVTAFAALGVLVLLVLIYFAIMIMTGNYESDWLDPII